MHRSDDDNTSPEELAALQMELDREGVGPRKLLAGALTLAGMDYPAAALEYAARAVVAARRDRDDESLALAAALVLTARNRGAA